QINFTAQSRPYDGTAAATITGTGCSVTGAVAGDSVTCDRSAATAIFADKNVGTAKTVTGTGFVLAGADAANYSFTTNATTANISQRDLSVAASGLDKVYDANSSATVTLSTDKIGGDDVTAHYGSASFADKSVANGKAVSVGGITIGGGDAGNYHLTNTTATATANITARDLHVTAPGVNRIYDTTTAATVTLTGDQLGGDDESATESW